MYVHTCVHMYICMHALSGRRAEFCAVIVARPILYCQLMHKDEMLFLLQDPADIKRIEYNNTDDTITIFLPTSKVHRWSEVLSDGCSVNGSDLHCENLVDCSALIVKGWAMSKLTWRFKLTFFQSNRCFKVLHCAC